MISHTPGELRATRRSIGVKPDTHCVPHVGLRFTPSFSRVARTNQRPAMISTLGASTHDVLSSNSFYLSADGHLFLFYFYCVISAAGAFRCSVRFPRASSDFSSLLDADSLALNNCQNCFHVITGARCVRQAGTKRKSRRNASSRTCVLIGRWCSSVQQESTNDI